MGGKFHQKNLRKGRVSLPGHYYSITKCCREHQPYLVSDLENLSSSYQIFEIIAESIAWLNENKRFSCKNFVMMADHVHLIFQLGESRTLEEVMHSFTSFAANRINKVLHRSGSVWQSGYYDHALRNDEAFNRHVRYIAENPLRAGLVKAPQDWPFSRIQFFDDT